MAKNVEISPGTRIVRSGGVDDVTNDPAAILRKAQEKQREAALRARRAAAAPAREAEWAEKEEAAAALAQERAAIDAASVIENAETRAETAAREEAARQEALTKSEQSN